MTFSDLLFALLFLAGLGSLIVASVTALRGRRARALAIVRRTGVVAALYFAVLILVSALSPQKFLSLGDDQCSDDWCIAVQAVGRDTVPTGERYDVSFRLSSRARRVAQRERFVTVYLRDQDGHRYRPAGDASANPFDTLLAPGQTVSVTQRFIVPAQTGIIGLVVAREGGGRFPGCCILGDEGSLLHRRTIVKLR